MLVSRLLVAIVLLPLGLLVIAYGGWLYALVIAGIMGLAGWEYVKLFRAGGLQPAGVLVPTGAMALVLGRYWNGFESAPWLLSFLILAGMIHHLVAYECGRDQAATDFNVTLGGVLYLGWIGAYLISLRTLPEGEWWVLLALPAVWLADTGAYFIGRRFGKRRLSPRLSPKKSWEGYLAGVVTATLGTALLAALWRIGAGPATEILPWRGAVLGLALSVLTPLGDLGESMIKRQMGVKDSSNLIPGHGGVFDRIDSWLWGGVLGYTIIVWFFI
ncbi:MAG: phosphatidate cytidylyltransferase [Anaerolineales bacterium]|nr:phosphatidate cytidylyltransferase [Anaerolineales bacterium]